MPSTHAQEHGSSMHEIAAFENHCHIEKSVCVHVHCCAICMCAYAVCAFTIIAGMYTWHVSLAHVRSHQKLPYSSVQPGTKMCTRFLFYKKPSSRPSTKSFLIYGHVLVLKVS